MIYIVKDPSKYAAQAAAGHDIIPQVHEVRTAARLEKDGHGKNFRALEGTASGPCLILGMGPSRHKLPAKVRVPVFGINRAAVEHPVDWWVAHDKMTLGVHGGVPKGVPLVTYACNWLRDEFRPVRDSGRAVWWYDIYADPTAHKKRPLYWNASTLGVLLDLTIRMGYGPVYTLGTDMTEGGYDNEVIPKQDLLLSHRELRFKMDYMFTRSQIPKWNPSGVKVLDLSGGNLKAERGDWKTAMRDLT
jgi:hypothetical protein